MSIAKHNIIMARFKKNALFLSVKQNSIWTQLIGSLPHRASDLRPSLLHLSNLDFAAFTVRALLTGSPTVCVQGGQRKDRITDKYGYLTLIVLG